MSVHINSVCSFCNYSPGWLHVALSYPVVLWCLLCWCLNISKLELCTGGVSNTRKMGGTPYLEATQAVFKAEHGRSGQGGKGMPRGDRRETHRRAASSLADLRSCTSTATTWVMTGRCMFFWTSIPVHCTRSSTICRKPPCSYTTCWSPHFHHTGTTQPAQVVWMLTVMAKLLQIFLAGKYCKSEACPLLCRRPAKRQAYTMSVTLFAVQAHVS